MNPFRFAFLDGAANTRHWPATDPDRVAFGSRFGFGQADSPERRIDIERVNGNPIAHFARGAVEQVRCGDFEIIVRSVGKGAAAVAIAERPDVGDAGLQGFVDDDIAVCVDLHARGLEPEIVRVRSAADGEQHMRTENLGFASCAIDADRDLRAPRFELNALRFKPNLNALGLQDFADRIRDFLVLPRNEPRRHLHHRDLCSQSPKNLRELEADIAPANDDKALGQDVEFKQRRVGQRPHLIATRKVGKHRPAADVDEEAFRLEHVVADGDRRGREEARVASDDRAVRHALQPGRET